jgi:hypothetical protein
MVRVQVAELEAAQQAGAPTYPDALESEWAGTASEALVAGSSAGSNLQLEAVDVFAGSDVEATPLEGLVNREVVDARNVTVADDLGVDLGSGMAAEVSASAERHETLMPSVDFVFEGHDENDVQIALEEASGEFAVPDAAEALRDGIAGSGPAGADATSWSDVGAGEYVPAIFADDVEAVPLSEFPSVTDGLVLDQTDEAMVFAAVPDAAPALEVAATDDMTFESMSIEATEIVDAVPAEAGMPTRVAVPSPVGVLSLDASEVLSLDERAREAVLTAFVARRNVDPVNVLERAPVADPAVVAALAAAIVVVADHAALPDVLESNVVWDAWTWGEDDPDLGLLETLVEAPISAVADPQLVVAEPAVEVPVAASVDPAETEAPIAVVDAVPAPPVERSGDPSPLVPAEADVAIDDEHGAVPPNFAAPVLVTVAMAALYEGQGHLREALATYRDLERRAPGAHAERIAALEARIAQAVPAPPIYAARLSGGQPAREFFGALLRTVPPALVRTTASRPEDGTALRKAADPVSLGRLFGEESSPAARPHAVVARTASLDEFYGAAPAPTEPSGRDDLESFHAWLQGLKT